MPVIEEQGGICAESHHLAAEHGVFAPRNATDVGRGVRVQAGPEAEYLSPAQFDWLVAGLQASPAVFKIVLNSVPIGEFPYPSVRDRWAGYPAQREALLSAINRFISAGRRELDVAVPAADGKTLAWLYRKGEVVDRQDGDEETKVTVLLDPADADRLAHTHTVRFL